MLQFLENSWNTKMDKSRFVTGATDVRQGCLFSCFMFAAWSGNNPASRNGCGAG